jgi:hypothetical protein
MKTTFILAGNFGVTPFDIMRQDLDEVILIVNYLSERGRASKTDNNTQSASAITEKEQDKEFWSAF